jgi:ATP-dependent DNA helicase DinG
VESELIQFQPVEVPKKNLQQNFSANIQDHFPFDIIRDGQRLVNEAVVRAYAENKKFIIVEAPTGSGKSGMAMAAASHSKTIPPVWDDMQPGAHILSPQKTLTKQYMRDFESMGLLELKGRANYVCNTFDTDCEQGADLCKSENRKAKADETYAPRKCFSCPYKVAKGKYINSPLGVTNFAYFLSETLHAGTLPDRTMLILDEGHNTEAQILSLAETTITQKIIDSFGLTERPFIKQGEDAKAIEWLNSTLVPAAEQTFKRLQGELFTAEENNDGESEKKVLKKIRVIQRFMQSLKYFIDSPHPNDWIVWSDKKTGDMNIRPLTAKLFAHDFLFKKAHKVLIMSATILDFRTFLRNLGIDRKDCIEVALGSEFPVENRPIYYRPIVNMSYKIIGDLKQPHERAEMDKMCTEVGVLMMKYFKHKGIVHTHSYKLNDYIIGFLRSQHGCDSILKTLIHNALLRADKQGLPQSELDKIPALITADATEKIQNIANRIVTHTGKAGERDAAVVEHTARVGEPTVLFSPSMTEGLDLKDDLSRFSIVVKVPFPYLDPYITARKLRDEKWYAWLTALALVQGTGRSNRHENDKAHHHILDEAFGYFVSRNEDVFPKWWLDSLKF